MIATDIQVKYNKCERKKIIMTSKKLSPKQMDSINKAEYGKKSAIWKWQGKMVNIIYNFYTPFIETPPTNNLEIESREEILSISNEFISKMRELASYEYDISHASITLGANAYKELTDKDELLAIQGIFDELANLYHELIQASAFKRNKVLKKMQMIKYFLSDWLYKENNQYAAQKQNCLNNYRNLYTIITTINRFGEELQSRDFDRMDCIYYYSVLYETIKNNHKLSDEDILSIFLAFINKNIWRNELLHDMASDNNPKQIIEENIKRNKSEWEIYKLQKKNAFLEVIKTVTE